MVEGAAAPETQSARTEVVRVDDRHLEALAEFFRNVWDPTATAEGVRRARAEAAAANPLGPGQDIPTFAFLTGGRAIGYVTTIPVRVWSDGAEHAAHWVKGLWVLPDHRNGPVGFFLLREAIRHLGCAMAIAADPAAIRVFTAAGFSDLGQIPNYLRLLAPAAVLRKLDLERLGLPRRRGLRRAAGFGLRAGLGTLGGLALGGLTSVWTAMRGAGPRRLQVRQVAAYEAAEIDAVWAEMRAALRTGAVRDARYLEWRYVRRADEPYRFVQVADGNRLVAVAVVRTPAESSDPRLGGIRVATLSDVVLPPRRSDVGLRLLRGAERAAREIGCEALLCSTTQPLLRSLLVRRAYLRLPGNIHLLTRDPDAKCRLPSTLDEWMVTRGDSDADGIS